MWEQSRTKLSHFPPETIEGVLFIKVMVISLATIVASMSACPVREWRGAWQGTRGHNDSAILLLGSLVKPGDDKTFPWNKHIEVSG